MNYITHTHRRAKVTKAKKKEMKVDSEHMRKHTFLVFEYKLANSKNLNAHILCCNPL